MLHVYIVLAFRSNERICVSVNVFANNKFSLLARHFGQQNSVSVIISNLFPVPFLLDFVSLGSLIQSGTICVIRTFGAQLNTPIRNMSQTSVTKAIASQNNTHTHKYT